MMNSVQIFTYAILILSTSTWAQFTQVRNQKLEISFDGNSNNPKSRNFTDITKFFLTLKQSIDREKIIFLQLTHIPDRENFFQNANLRDFSVLKHLKIKFSELNSLSATAFQGLYLESLDISNNTLTSVKHNLFEHTKELRTLKLSANKITHLPSNVLKNVNQLINLDLSANQLDYLTRDLFRPVETLYNLFLNNNTITKVDQDVFDDLGSHLRKLDLSFNKIAEINGNLFSKLGNLTQLKLTQAFDNITTLPSNIFLNAEKLLEIDMDWNNLMSLPEDIFNNNPQLQRLNLANNKLTKLGDAIFKKNFRLNKLNLENNQLKFLNKTIFSKMTALTELNLDNNHLTNLHPEIFSNLVNLQSITISNNQVNLAGPSYNSNLYNCPQIKSIYARNNNIPKIYNDWRHQDKQLEVLDLRFNPVVENLHNLDFVSNNISFYLTHDNSVELRLNNLLLLEMNEFSDSRYILDKNTKCEPDCACVIELLYDEKRMKIHFKRFNAEELLPEIPSFIIKYASTIDNEMILSNCNLSSLYPVLPWLKQIEITKLSLSSNHLSSLDGLPELPRLKTLELHDNEFTSLDSKTLDNFNRLTNLKDITLHQNPWECDCGLIKFYTFVHYHNERKQIRDPSNITCENLDKKPLLKLTIQDLCTLNLKGNNTIDV